MNVKTCNTCGNNKFSLDTGKYECTLPLGQMSNCIANYCYWKEKEDELIATLDAEWLGTEIAHTIYRQGKAKIFNVLESQIENNQRLAAAKRITEDVLSNIAKDAKKFIIDILEDWKTKVSIPEDAVLSSEEENEAQKEWSATAEEINSY